MNALLLWIAQGFGIGRIPIAPGTWGSVLGLLWTMLLLCAGNFTVFLVGTAIGIVLSVWVCGAGEKQLRQKDPGSIVFDEIAAMPVCFIGWIAFIIWNTGGPPAPGYFVQVWAGTLGVFAAFRFFDVAKPWPVRQSQSLAGGWGVTADDILAALWVNVVLGAVFLVGMLFQH